mgnify:CR=1 FL=1
MTQTEDLYPTAFFRILKLEHGSLYSYMTDPAIEIYRSHMKIDTGHDEGHIVRVMRNAMNFAHNFVDESADPDVIIPATILHDLVNLPKTSLEQRSKSSRLSAELAIDLLGKNTTFKDNVHRDKIFNAIEAHSYSANVEPLSIEAKAVQDADRVDALGMIGIGRLFSVGNSLGREMFHSNEPLPNRWREPDEYKYTVDHFYTKLIKIQFTMKTTLGKMIAEKLTNKMIKFMNDLKDENIGDYDES